MSLLRIGSGAKAVTHLPAHAKICWRGRPVRQFAGVNLSATGWVTVRVAARQFAVFREESLACDR